MSSTRLPLLAFLLLGLLCAAAPATASEPVYPKGSRIGLVPPDGIVPMKGAMGFENPANNLIVSFRELPPAAFESIDSAVRDGTPMPAAMEKAESFTTAAGKAYRCINNRAHRTRPRRPGDGLGQPAESIHHRMPSN